MGRAANFLRQNSLDFSRSEVINHVELAETTAPTQGKNLAQKNSGKFYTPDAVGNELVRQALAARRFKSGEQIRIIDPFCGDGRLILRLLPSLVGLRGEIHLWDYDAEAIKTASRRVQDQVLKLGLALTIHPRKVDTFSEFFEGWEGAFDFVITNPPWEVIKPDPKDLDGFANDGLREMYVTSLKDFSERLLRDFPVSRPSKVYGGWGVNLARVGTELSIRLAKHKGVAAIVSPATIFADQNSDSLRRWMFSENNMSNLDIYPAELKLFADVDQPFVTFVLTRDGTQKKLTISNHQKLAEPTRHTIEDLASLLISTDYILPVAFAASPTHLQILANLRAHGTLSNLEAHENLWLGRELDETNHQSWLSANGRYRFIKGRDIDRFTLGKSAQTFVDEKMLKTRIPVSVEFQRIAWRDVSRPSQKRRVIAALIPPGYVTGNSLGVLHIEQSQNAHSLAAILGLMSSLVFEFQLRALLATAHVSAGVLRKIRIPAWESEFVSRIAALANERISGSTEAEHLMEIQIARSYGLNRGQFSEILEAFPKVSKDERTALLSPSLWKK
jgi:Alw26I/Eco31I/Esp3I family type II restriction m6 adenine DNA methyltransferase